MSLLERVTVRTARQSGPRKYPKRETIETLLSKLG